MPCPRRADRLAGAAGQIGPEPLLLHLPALPAPGAIYISHRLSSCKFCDEIAVFHNGQVVQQGTHEALLADETGKYYALWNAQAQYYTQPQ